MKHVYIDQRAGGTYRVRVSVQIEDKQINTSTTYIPVPGFTADQNRQAAEQMGVEFIEKVKQEYLEEKARKEITFGDYYRDAYLTKAVSRYADTTYHLNVTTIEKFFLEKFDNVKLKDITRNQLQEMIQELANKENENEDLDDPVCIGSKTIKRYVTTFRSVINMALEDNVIDTNPFVGGLSYPRVMPTNIVYLDKEDFELIIADLGRKIGSGICALDMLDVMVAIGVLTGVRRGELVALRWGDFINLDGVHFESVQISISHSVSKVKGKPQKYGPTKTPASTRMFNIPELLARVLWAWKQELTRRGVPTDKHNSVICDPMGQMVSIYSPTKWFHQYLEQHALKNVRLHSLRHTFASLLFEQKMSLTKVMWVMGHTDIATTQIYLHLFDLNNGRLMAELNAYTTSLLDGLGGAHAN